MGRRYLSDVILDDEISTWKAGDNIVISSPTGSGKSTFVLKTLLPRAIAQGKHILYFCSRKILNEQLQVASNNSLVEFFGASADPLSTEQLQSIHVLTYQYCEISDQFPYFQKPEFAFLNPENILYYIFDEAHYFLSDALFNSGTNRWWKSIPVKSINIFLTATPEPLYHFLAARNPTFRFDEQLLRLHQKYKEKAALTRKLQNESVYREIGVSLKTGKATVQPARKKTQREIAAECRTFDVYQDCLDSLQMLRSNLNVKNLPDKNILPDYDRFDTFYFHKYTDLLPIIQKTTPEEEWLIFVDKEQNGIDLAARLSQLGIQTMFLTSKSIRRNGPEKEEFQRIAHNKSFSCPVLIATQVLDCGVSITGSSVKHVVISHHRKETFLQMLGRRRLVDEGQLYLYIRNFSGKSINGVVQQLEKNMRLLVSFSQLNQVDVAPNKYYSYTDNYDGMKEEPILSDIEKNRTLKEIFRKQNYALTRFVPLSRRARSGAEVSDYQRNKDPKLEEFEYSKTAFISLLYDLSEYQDALKRNFEVQDPYFYLKRQLSWIDKEYDETHWVNYYETRAELIGFLSKFEDTWMLKPVQTEFAKTCLELFLKFPAPPEKLRKDASRYSRGSTALPGLKKLNDALTEKNIPFRIKSKQKRTPQNPERTTCWRIIRR